jgi:hypothetical protein
MFQVTTDVLGVSTAPAAVSFDLPTGYKKAAPPKR